MNAGANGQEVKDALLEALYLGLDGEERLFLRSDLEFSYRFSSFQKLRGCILAARFELKENKEARQSQLKIVEYRLKTQPYKEKSAGCIFRNPSPSLSAGALIERCGLKGSVLGGARVSEMHANFIVNEAKASCTDVLALIQKIQETVAEKSGVRLEPEVRKVPFDE